MADNGNWAMRRHQFIDRVFCRRLNGRIGGQGHPREKRRESGGRRRLAPDVDLAGDGGGDEGGAVFAKFFN